jgi:hypothetical protein
MLALAVLTVLITTWRCHKVIPPLLVPAADSRQWISLLESGTPFRQALTDLGITSNRVWGLARHDAEWSDALEAVLRSTRPPNLNHGSYSAYLKGCVCRECREANLLRIKAGKRTA